MNHSSRREFLKRIAQLSTARITGATALSLMAARDVSAFTAGDDYKALVMVHLNGGNDHNSLLIPLDEKNYSTYANIRGANSIAQEDILTLNSTEGLADGAMGLHPSLKNTQDLFNTGNAAIIQNIGILAEPLTLDEFKDKSKQFPPHLFAHNHQRTFSHFTWHRFF